MQARPIFLNENDEMHSRDEWIGALTLLSARLPAYHAMAVGRQTIWTYKIDTAGTDGVYIYINPDFFLSLPTASQRAFLIAHEVGHIVASHMARGKVFNDRGYLAKGVARDNGLYNEAADYIINDDLIAGNLEFIPCALHYPSFTLFGHQHLDRCAHGIIPMRPLSAIFSQVSISPAAIIKPDKIIASAPDLSSC